jgi:hypothetical protein
MIRDKTWWEGEGKGARDIHRTVKSVRTMTLSSSPEKRFVEGGRRGSPKVLRFSIDINSSVPGSLWDGFVGIEVVRDERELVAVSEIKDCLLKSGEAVEEDEVVD